MKSRIATFTPLLLFVLALNLLSQVKETKGPSFNLKVTNTVDDSIVTIHYSVTEKNFAELFIVNRQGFVFEKPLSKDVEIGEDSVKIWAGNYLTGTYFVQCKINHQRVPIMKMFRHARKGQRVTYSSDELRQHNELPSCDQAKCPVAELTKFDAFLTRYPNYIDKGEVFQRALLAYVKLDQDSTLIARTIDSLVTYLPSFYSYYSIARYLSENDRLPSLAKKYVLEARRSMPGIPSDQQNEYSSKLAELEK